MLFRIYGSCEKFQESIVSNTEISEELRSVPLFSFPPKRLGIFQRQMKNPSISSNIKFLILYSSLLNSLDA